MTTPTIFQWYQILRQHYRCTVLQAIRGVTKKEKLILTDSGKGTPAGNIIGTMALDRKDYGMNSNIPFIKIANRVQVDINLRWKRISGPPPAFAE